MSNAEVVQVLHRCAQDLPNTKKCPGCPLNGTYHCTHLLMRGAAERIEKLIEPKKGVQEQ